MVSDDSMMIKLPEFVPVLPEFDPNPALWERIRSGNVRRVRRRRFIQLGSLGLSVALVAVLGFGLMRGSGEDPSLMYGVSDGRLHSQQLQDELSSNGSGFLDSALQSRLRLVDSELQAAYDHGAGDTELQPLWKLRNQLLESLVRQDGEPGRQLTRI